MSTANFQLDTQRQGPGLEYLRGMRAARKSGKGFAAMTRELTSLMFGPGKLQPKEYFMYGLYDDARFTAEVKRTFVGSSGPMVPTPWAEIVHDKPTLTALLRGLDLPTPETQAVMHPERTCAGAVALRSREELLRFLREQAEYPVFGKPFDSACSLGTAHIAGYDAATDCLQIAGEQVIDVEAFADQVEQIGSGYLLQSLMLPHEKLVPIIGDRVSTVRMFVLSDHEGCVLLRASWKIPAGENGADNFWRPGNVLAGIDVDTGRIVRALRRTPEGTEPIDQHPVSGASFDGMVFPEWQAMRETVLQAAVNLPGCHFQGWDVALTDRGPVLVELEGDGGDPIMEQLCFDSGLLQGRYLKLVESVDEIKKEKQAKDKKRRRQTLKENFAQLARPAGRTSAQASEACEAAAEEAEAAGDGAIASADAPQQQREPATALSQ